MELAIKYFIAFSEVALIFPLLVAIRMRNFWRKILTLRLLASFLLVSVIQLYFVIPYDILMLKGHETFNTIFYYNWQYVITAFIKLGIYHSLLNFKFKSILFGISVAILAVVIALEFRTDSLTFHNTHQLVTNSILVTNLLITLLSLIYAYQQLQDLSVEDITKYSFFWLNSGFLIYHLGSIFVYSFVGNGADSQEAIIAWVVNGLLLLFLYVTVSFTYHYSKKLPQRA